MLEQDSASEKPRELRERSIANFVIANYKADGEREKIQLKVQQVLSDIRNGGSSQRDNRSSKGGLLGSVATLRNNITSVN